MRVTFKLNDLQDVELTADGDETAPIKEFHRLKVEILREWLREHVRLFDAEFKEQHGSIWSPPPPPPLPHQQPPPLPTTNPENQQRSRFSRLITGIVEKVRWKTPAEKLAAAGDGSPPLPSLEAIHAKGRIVRERKKGTPTKFTTIAPTPGRWAKALLGASQLPDITTITIDGNAITAELSTGYAIHALGESKAITDLTRVIKEYLTRSEFAHSDLRNDTSDSDEAPQHEERAPSGYEDESERPATPGVRHLPNAEQKVVLLDLLRMLNESDSNGPGNADSLRFGPEHSQSAFREDRTVIRVGIGPSLAARASLSDKEADVARDLVQCYQKQLCGPGGSPELVAKALVGVSDGYHDLTTQKLIERLGWINDRGQLPPQINRAKEWLDQSAPSSPKLTQAGFDGIKANIQHDGSRLLAAHGFESEVEGESSIINDITIKAGGQPTTKNQLRIVVSASKPLAYLPEEGEEPSSEKAKIVAHLLITSDGFKLAPTPIGKASEGYSERWAQILTDYCNGILVFPSPNQPSRADRSNEVAQTAEPINKPSGATPMGEPQSSPHPPQDSVIEIADHPVERNLNMDEIHAVRNAGGTVAPERWRAAMVHISRVRDQNEDPVIKTTSQFWLNAFLCQVASQGTPDQVAILLDLKASTSFAMVYPGGAPLTALDFARQNRNDNGGFIANILKVNGAETYSQLVEQNVDVDEVEVNYAPTKKATTGPFAKLTELQSSVGAKREELALQAAGISITQQGIAAAAVKNGVFRQLQSIPPSEQETVTNLFKTGERWPILSKFQTVVFNNEAFEILSTFNGTPEYTKVEAPALVARATLAREELSEIRHKIEVLDFVERRYLTDAQGLKDELEVRFTEERLSSTNIDWAIVEAIARNPASPQDATQQEFNQVIDAGRQIDSGGGDPETPSTLRPPVYFDGDSIAFEVSTAENKGKFRVSKDPVQMAALRKFYRRLDAVNPAIQVRAQSESITEKPSAALIRLRSRSDADLTQFEIQSEGLATELTNTLKAVVRTDGNQAIGLSPIDGLDPKEAEVIKGLGENTKWQKITAEPLPCDISTDPNSTHLVDVWFDGHGFILRTPENPESAQMVDFRYDSKHAADVSSVLAKTREVDAKRASAIQRLGAEAILLGEANVKHIIGQHQLYVERRRNQPDNLAFDAYLIAKEVSAPDRPERVANPVQFAKVQDKGRILDIEIAATGEEVRRVTFHGSQFAVTQKASEIGAMQESFVIVDAKQAAKARAYFVAVDKVIPTVESRPRVEKSSQIRAHSLDRNSIPASQSEPSQPTAPANESLPTLAPEEPLKNPATPNQDEIRPPSPTSAGTLESKGSHVRTPSLEGDSIPASQSEPSQPTGPANESPTPIAPDDPRMLQLGLTLLKNAQTSTSAVLAPSARYPLARITGLTAGTKSESVMQLIGTQGEVVKKFLEDKGMVCAMGSVSTTGDITIDQMTCIDGTVFNVKSSAAKQFPVAEAPAESPKEHMRESAIPVALRKQALRPLPVFMDLDVIEQSEPLRR